MDRPPTSMQFTFMLGFNPAGNRHKSIKVGKSQILYLKLVFFQRQQWYSHIGYGEKEFGEDCGSLV